VVGLSLGWMLALGLPTLAMHLVAIALMKALQSYSRSLLEELCAERGHLERAEDVSHHDHRTERAAEALAVLTGLLLAALVGVGMDRLGSPLGVEMVILPVLLIGLLGFVIAGVVGKVFAETILDAIWPAAAMIRAIASPLTLGLRLVERLVEWMAGPSQSSPRPASLELEIPSEDETTNEDAEPEIPESARLLLQQAVGMTRTDVAELMTPRTAVVSLPSSVTAEDAALTFRESVLSRIPIYGENRDDIMGILYAKDLFARFIEAHDFSRIRPIELVRSAHFVPESKNAFELLEELRIERRQIAMVLDEYGGLAGVVTLEDLLEKLVGSIVDEHDKPAPTDPVRALGDSRFELEATIPLEEVNERLDLELPTGGEFETLGGLAFHELGRVPEPGETFHAYGVGFTVVEVSDHTIRRLVISKG
jgi:CBS domain containing-hemolysin-like protein